MKNCTCYYFDDRIKFENCNFDNILTDKKSYKNILIYNVYFKTLIEPKPFQIRFFKKDGIIRIYDWTIYLSLFDSKVYEAI